MRSRLRVKLYLHGSRSTRGSISAILSNSSYFVPLAIVALRGFLALIGRRWGGGGKKEDSLRSSQSHPFSFSFIVEAVRLDRWSMEPIMQIDSQILRTLRERTHLREKAARFVIRINA